MNKIFADINKKIEDAIKEIRETTTCTNPHLPISIWIGCYGVWYITIWPEEGYF